MKYLPQIWLIALSALTLLSACVSQSEEPYQTWVEEEGRSGVRHDSLFLGFHFGMSREAFIDTCWKLNQRGLIRNGPRKESIQYDLPDLTPLTRINFYPEFTADQTIFEVPILVGYKTWAPWLPATSSDSLMTKLQKMVQTWYRGNEFRRFDFPELPPMWIKIDGNRRIALLREDEQFAKLVITDLSKLETEKDRLLFPPANPLIERRAK
ncbi:MAG: hypothetical protein AAF804_20155 [Bacteroidota bacterium]